MRNVRLWFAFGCLLLLCSCSTTPPPSAFIPAPELPAPIAMNEDAGRGGWLIVPIRMEHGEEMPFILDTGAPVTCLDQSLEPKLGKRVHAGTAIDGNRRKHKMKLYKETKLYLGNTQLMTGNLIVTMDLKWLSSQTHCPVMGILGMDCLSHYCIQLDFKSEQVRFLNPDSLDAAKLGKAIPLSFSGARLPGNGWCGTPHVQASPLTFFSASQGGKTRDFPSIQLLDTGDNADGTLSSALFRREVREQRLEAKEGVADIQLDLDEKTVSFDKFVWDGDTYTNLNVGNPNGGGAIGLGFLARHLVTFNFPQRMMYLQQTSIGPLPDDGKEAAWKFIRECARNKGGLPGGPLHGTASLDRTIDWPEDTFECVIYLKEDSTRYHYVIARASENAPWKLQKAWRTDDMGRMIEEFPVR